MHQLLLTIGIFFASLIAYGFVTYVNNGWQYVQAFPCIPALVMILFAGYIPESPKWLLSKKNDRAAAIAVLSRLRGPEDNIETEVHCCM